MVLLTVSELLGLTLTGAAWRGSEADNIVISHYFVQLFYYSGEDYF